MIQLKTPRLRNHTTSKFRIMFLEYDDEGHHKISEMYSSNQIEDLFDLEHTRPMDLAVITNLYAPPDQAELYVGLTVQAMRRLAIQRKIEDAKALIAHYEALR